MKSVGSSSKAAAPDVASIGDQLRAINTSTLEKVLEIREEQGRLASYRQRAEGSKGKVDRTVWQRVTDDYTRRNAALEQNILPLKAQVRDEFQKLRTLLERVTKANDEARLAKEEMEFRHEVGELDDQQLKQAVEGPTKIVDKCRDELEQIEELKAQFLAALRREELEYEPAKAVEPQIPEPPVSVAGSASNYTLLDESMTRDVAGPPDLDVNDGRTVLVPMAALILGEGAERSEFPLGAVNVIGRISEAQIRLTGSGISRRHATIMLGASGFTIKDLGSQNGTLVNGVAVTEAALADGNQIEVGDVKLVFREPWPAASS